MARSSIWDGTEWVSLTGGSGEDDGGGGTPDDNYLRLDAANNNAPPFNFLRQTEGDARYLQDSDVSGVFLPLSGGTMSGSIELEHIDGIAVYNQPGAGAVRIGFASVGNATGRIRLGGNAPGVTALEIQGGGDIKYARFEQNRFEAVSRIDITQTGAIRPTFRIGQAGGEIVEWFNHGVRRALADNAGTYVRYEPDGGTATYTLVPGIGQNIGVQNPDSSVARNIQVSTVSPGPGDGIDGDCWMRWRYGAILTPYERTTSLYQRSHHSNRRGMLGMESL